jgi:hypothetical protein
MGSGKGGLRADRRSSREPATLTETQNEKRLTTPPALSAGGSAITGLALYHSEPKQNESPDVCSVEMTFVKRKRSNIIRFTFGGVDRQSRLANATIPFLLEALCKIPVDRSADGVITTKVKRGEDYQELGGRDPKLVCRVIDHLRHSGLKDHEIVRLMNGTSFSEFLSRGDLTFEGDEAIDLHYTGRPDMALAIVQETLEDLCASGAYELASRILDWKTVQDLDPEELYHRGNCPLRSIGGTLKQELTRLGRDLDIGDDKEIDKEFRPLRRVFAIALEARRDTAKSSSESLVESSSRSPSSSDPLVISEDSSDPLVISEDV